MRSRLAVKAGARLRLIVLLREPLISGRQVPSSARHKSVETTSVMEPVAPPRIGAGEANQQKGSIMRITTCLAAAVVPALLATTLAFAQDQQAKTFLTEAIEGNLAEVQMGQLAQKLATTLAIRSYGQMP